jgi:hypothetical protein
VTATVADLDAAAVRLGMPIIEMDRTTWRLVVAEWNALVDRATKAERDLDGARSLIARAEIAMRERQIAHDKTSARADELAAQVVLLADALRDVLALAPGASHLAPAAHRHAAGLLHAITTTTRTTR